MVTIFMFSGLCWFIMKHRFLRLQVKLIHDIRHSAFRLPPVLSLQPLVENAVKYGVGKGFSPEHILVKTHAEKDCLVLTVEDDGPGFGPESIIDEGHVGIMNVRSRLSMMCGGSLEIQSSTDSGTIVTVMIPNESSKT